MAKPRWSVAVLVLVCAVATPAAAQERPVAGRIKVSTGAAFVVRDGAQIPAQVGQVVFETDGVRTGADGKIGVTLNDDTRLSLGPNSELKLERFTYAPAERGFGLVLRFVRGAATYVSGRIAKLAPDSIRLETPAAIIGVRGTTLAINVLPE
ncbi:MAG TPA: FecR domain-containing protein [Vicinamibacterales bacterium]|nr:FecR domain-containing protein [Vicinamibacterales bacterium]